MISTNLPVYVICMIAKTGKITPLKLRMDMNDRITILCRRAYVED